jgi:chromosomal replication initiator protein
LTVSYVVGDSLPGEDRPFQSPSSQESVGPEASTAYSSITVDPACTFESFVAGASTQLAYAAALAVAANPGTSYNPLFLYGGVGLGKTHLMHAIGNRAAAAGYSVAYATSEEFTNGYLDSLRQRQTPTFRRQYQAVSLLLIDDIQFLAGKSATQEAFFHIFNSVRRAGGQLVISSDRPAGSLSLLEPRLRSRFQSGLEADLEPPDIDTRIAILQSFASKASFSVELPILTFLAENITDHVRALHGAFNRLMALSNFTDRIPNLDLAQAALGPHVPSVSPQLSPSLILTRTADYFGVPLSAILGTRRDRLASTARQTSMYLLHDLLRLSPHDIGATLGHRDRSTIAYGLTRIQTLIATHKSFAADLTIIRETLTPDSHSPRLSTSA